MTEPDADAQLIDRLYAGGADDDLEGLRMVRGLVARVRDEMPGVEPPAAISAQLILAATPVKPGVWARMRTWFAGIAMHPGLAAAATLVIVAGAAAIWMRQGGKAAEPTVTSTAPPTEERAEPPRDDDHAEDTVAPVVQDRADLEADKDVQDVRPPDSPPEPAKKKTKPRGGDGGKVAVSGEAEGAGSGSFTPDVTKGRRTRK